MQMQNYMREQQMAIQLARGRDLFHWWAAFYAVAAIGATAGYYRYICFSVYNSSVNLK